MNDSHIIINKLILNILIQISLYQWYKIINKRFLSYQMKNSYLYNIYSLKIVSAEECVKSFLNDFIVFPF